MHYDEWGRFFYLPYGSTGGDGGGEGGTEYGSFGGAGAIGAG